LSVAVGYKNTDVIFVWTTGNQNSVVITENITMSQFKHFETTVTNYSYSRMNDSNGKLARRCLTLDQCITPLYSTKLTG